MYFTFFRRSFGVAKYDVDIILGVSHYYQKLGRKNSRCVLFLFIKDLSLLYLIGFINSCILYHFPWITLIIAIAKSIEILKWLQKILVKWSSTKTKHIVIITSYRLLLVSCTITLCDVPYVIGVDNLYLLPGRLFTISTLSASEHIAFGITLTRIKEHFSVRRLTTGSREIWKPRDMV